MTSTVKRCIKCNLPSNYPGAVFDSEGVCHLCNDNADQRKKIENKKYKGKKQLLADFNAIINQHPDRSKTYDCILSYSGGRDSSYLMYILTKELNLKVLATMGSHKFYPEATWKNANEITKKLNVDLKVVENEYLNKCSPHFLKAWKFNPVPETIQSICTGCLYGYYQIALAAAKKHKIPVVFFAENPYEMVRETLRLALLKIEKEKFDKLNLQTASVILKNPKLLSSPNSMKLFKKEMPWYFNRDQLFIDSGVKSISPFFEYIKWREQDMYAVLKELDWGFEEGFKDTWGADCYIKVIQQYFYYATLGFNDRDIFISEQIRQGALTLEEGIERLSEQNNFSKEYVAEVMDKYWGCDFYEYDQKLTRLYN
jgi:glucosamine--fructose-6-phosphate aminotransferase (isomerizing)